MSVSLDTNASHRIESANYVTNVMPVPHPDRVLPVHDFLYILDGDWEIYEDDIPYQMEKDDLLILSAGHHHYGRKNSSPGNRHMYIHLYPENGASAPDVPLLSGGSSPLFHCASVPRIRQYFKEVIATYWSDTPLREEKLSLLFGLLLCEIKSLNSARQKEIRHPEVVEAIVELLQTNSSHMYSCGEMASRFFICSRTLSDLFRQAFGVSFYQYQMNMKLEMVRQYLSDHPDEILANVARNYGFYDEFHLGKTFKKKYGYSPKRKA